MQALRMGLRTAADQDLIDGVLDAEHARRRSDAEFAVRITELALRAEAANSGIAGAGIEEIGWLLGLSSRSVARLVDSCEALVSRPLVWDGLHEGLIDRPRALKIVHLLADIPDPLREELEAKAIAYAIDHTNAQLHRKLLRMTCDNDPEETQRKEALDNRGLCVTPRGHGMASIAIDISVEHAQAFIQGLDAYAKAKHCDPYEQGDDRTLEQLRADALVSWLADNTTWNVDVQVVIPADMLMGVETSGADLNGSPITHSLALQLAWSPDARWTRLVTDPLTGVLLDAGSTKYEIPKRLRTAVRLRDGLCRWPNCTRPAEYTDTDHVERYADSKHTHPDELVCLCRYHHRLKTFGVWQINTGSTYAMDLVITGPLGTTRRTHPRRYNRRD